MGSITDEAKRLAASVPYSEWAKAPSDYAECEQCKRRSEALQTIVDLVMELPCGVDLDADSDDVSPDDLVAHIGGLIIQEAELAGVIPKEFQPLPSSHPPAHAKLGDGIGMCQGGK